MMKSVMAKVGLALLAVLGLLVSGCSTEGDDVPTVHGSKDLSQKLMSVLESGEATPLAEMTDFSWDQVVLFHEGASAEEVESVVGTDVLEGRYLQSPNLFVFLEDGQVVEALATYPDAFWRRFGVPLGADTVVSRPEDRPTLLLLAEPEE